MSGVPHSLLTMSASPRTVFVRYFSSVCPQAAVDASIIGTPAAENTAIPLSQVRREHVPYFDMKGIRLSDASASQGVKRPRSERSSFGQDRQGWGEMEMVASANPKKP